MRVRAETRGCWGNGEGKGRRHEGGFCGIDSTRERGDMEEKIVQGGGGDIGGEGKEKSFAPRLVSLWGITKV